MIEAFTQLLPYLSADFAVAAFSCLLMNLCLVADSAHQAKRDYSQFDVGSVQGHDSYEIIGAEAALHHEIAAAQACANKDQLQRSVSACEKRFVHHDTNGNAKSSKGLEYACTVANRFEALSSCDDDD
eukprot:10348474-Karenia_brevis.AAC.1